MLVQNRPATNSFVTFVDSRLGKLTLFADEQAICGLYLPTQAASVQPILDHAMFTRPQSLPIFESASAFLEAYFAKQRLPELPPMNLRGTPFQMLVWDELRKIPAGETCSYSEISEAMGRPTATRAVGKAIGDNPISILVPCHRVIGRSGALTGYAGGLDNKRWLLAHEGALLNA
jgi:methylated-DNA-[protein]-cysteine S-methyltransferase